MSSNPSNPNAPRAGGWLARLKGLVENMKPNDDPSTTEEVLPSWDVALPPAAPAADAVPIAQPVPAAEGNATVSAAHPVEAAPAAQPELAAEAVQSAKPAVEEIPAIPSPLAAEPAAPRRSSVRSAALPAKATTRPVATAAITIRRPISPGVLPDSLRRPQSPRVPPCVYKTATRCARRSANDRA